MTIKDSMPSKITFTKKGKNKDFFFRRTKTKKIHCQHNYTIKFFTENSLGRAI